MLDVLLSLQPCVLIFRHVPKLNRCLRLSSTSTPIGERSQNTEEEMNIQLPWWRRKLVAYLLSTHDPMHKYSPHLPTFAHFFTNLHTASMISPNYQSSSHIQMSSSTSPPPYSPPIPSSRPTTATLPGRPATSAQEQNVPDVAALPPAYITETAHVSETIYNPETSPLPRPVTALPPRASFLSEITGGRVAHFPKFRALRFPGIRFPHAPRRDVAYEFYFAAQTREVDRRTRSRSRAATVVVFCSGLWFCLILLVVVTELEEATTNKQS